MPKPTGEVGHEHPAVPGKLVSRQSELPLHRARFASDISCSGDVRAPSDRRGLGAAKEPPSMPSSPTPWTSQVWAEFHAGNLTRAARDVLLTLRTYRGHGGMICPGHAALAARANCHASTVWRSLQAARDLGLVRWTERRVRAAWRSLRTSNRYTLTDPEAPLTPRPRTTMQDAGGGERRNPRAREGGVGRRWRPCWRRRRGMPDLLAMRRAVFERAVSR